jgi:hypothetical protein
VEFRVEAQSARVLANDKERKYRLKGRISTSAP